MIGGIVGGNLYLAYRLRPLLRPRSAEQHALDRYRMLLSGRIGWWIGIISGLIGLFAGISGQGHWQTWLLFVNGGSFGVKDPQFGTDIGWYVFDYPFWRYLLGVGFTTMTLSLIGTLAMHYIFGGVRLQGRGERITTAARAQITTLVAVFILLKAIAYVLDKHGLLLDHIASINSTGAGYTDINALVPAKTILAWISVIVAVAVLVFSNAFIRNLVWPGMAIGLLVISAIAIGGIYPFAVQHFVVNPNLPSKELTYISRSIDATRTAFGLSNIKTTQYPADESDAAARSRGPTPARCRTSGCSTRPSSPTPTHSCSGPAASTTSVRSSTSTATRPAARPRTTSSAFARSTTTAQPGRAGTGRTPTRSTPTGPASSPRRPTRRSARARRTSSPACSTRVRPVRIRLISSASPTPTNSQPRCRASTTAKEWARTRSSASRPARSPT